MTDTEYLVEQIADALLQQEAQLVTAESCTGGGIAQALTERAGSSLWFERGFVTYANAAKIELLGVPESTLLHQGAVSEACARAMAEGALRASPADWSLSVTGIAGPGGGSVDKPVGTVCFAWARREGGCQAETRVFDGDRATVRQHATQHALRGLLQRIRDQARIRAD